MFPVRSSVTGVRGAKVTVALALANVLVFLFETSLPPESLDALVGTGRCLPDQVVGEILRVKGGNWHGSLGA